MIQLSATAQKPTNASFSPLVPDSRVTRAIRMTVHELLHDAVDGKCRSVIDLVALREKFPRVAPGIIRAVVEAMLADADQLRAATIRVPPPPFVVVARYQCDSSNARLRSLQLGDCTVLLHSGPLARYQFDDHTTHNIAAELTISPERMYWCSLDGLYYPVHVDGTRRIRTDARRRIKLKGCAKRMNRRPTNTDVRDVIRAAALWTLLPVYGLGTAVASMERAFSPAWLDSARMRDAPDEATMLDICKGLYILCVFVEDVY